MSLKKIIENKKGEILLLIEKYKEHIRNGGLKSEETKWFLFEKQKGLPNLNLNTIVDELYSLEYGNLLYHNALAVMKHLRHDRKEKYADILFSLYDESVDLQDRINFFDNNILEVYRELIPSLGHHHDERTMSLLLSFKYPEKYLLYKNSFYTQLCKLLGIKSESKNKKYVHYLQLAEHIKDMFIREDLELLDLVKEHLPNGSYDDPNYNLLTQDFLYMTLEKNNANHELFKEIKVLFTTKLDSLSNCIIAKGNDDDNDFQRVKDRWGIIGSDFVHYELYWDGVFIYIDLHLENTKGKSKGMSDLLFGLYTFLLDKNYKKEDVKFFEWEKNVKGYKSLRFSKCFLLNDIDLLSEYAIDEMIKSFVDFDKIIGDDVRSFLIKKNKVDEEIKQKYITERMMQNPLNQILYGPPGTGKTYNTINKAVAIANPGFVIKEDRKAVKDEYNRLVKEGRIVFTTFHQSMSYEDFVEGIKPLIEENDIGDKTIIYEVKDGVFKELAERANNARLNQSNRNESYGFDDAWNELIREINQSYEESKQFVLDVQTPKLGMDVKSISGKGNLNLKPIYSENAGDYTVSYSRAKKLNEAFPDLSIVKNIDKEFRSVIGGSNSTAYWAVLNYINPLVVNNKSKTISEGKPALNTNPHVLIIDEINRGNVSQIFGELITLIEEDKRLGNDEAIEITLPYSKTKFGVPPNLHIIGTMNTADRSVEALDSALRRRFVFEELMPKYEGIEGLDYSVYGFKASEILKTINKRIEILLDKDHQIGHAYFLNKDGQSIITSFYKNIIPLLQEYFFGDYGKIGLVLGNGFVDTATTRNEFANFVYDDVSTYNDVKIYSIIDYRVPNKVGTFENAIEKLMNIEKS